MGYFYDILLVVVMQILNLFYDELVEDCNFITMLYFISLVNVNVYYIICMYTYMFICLYVYMCMFICVCLYVYVYVGNIFIFY